jgi:VIT1/CCC1 family predicted Fe2+/Mn2+ transporter
VSVNEQQRAKSAQADAGVLARWRAADDRNRLLQVVQPSLIGLIDGTVSTLAPIFAAAFISGSRAALLVGLAASLGAAISMGLSEALSDDGTLTGRGSSLVRGLITGAATFVGGVGHALPFLINDLSTALTVAYVVVACELVVIAWIRKRFLNVSLRSSLIQVTAGGVVVAFVGFAVGHAG